MKINPKLKIRTMAGETIVLLQSEDPKQPTKVLALNETAKFLWENLYGQDFDISTAVELIMDNYEGVTEEQADSDVSKWIEQLKSVGAIL